MHLRTLSVAAAAFVVLVQSVAAQAPDDCAELGAAITEHTCFHARFGPFEEVNATAGTVAGRSTPDIDRVHTHYRVHLTAEVSTVTYTPKRSGHWAVYMDPDLTLEVLQEDGRRVLPVRVGDVEACPFLLRVTVYDLELNQRYRYVFAPSTATQVVIVNEKVDDFLTVHARDADGDGYGDPEQTMVSACVPATGYVDNDGDCDDSDPKVSPAATEICDGIDQNCNRVSDDIGELCRRGAGPCSNIGVWGCPFPDAPAQCSATEDRSQAMVESCNGLDDDCDGTIDDGNNALCALEDDAPYCVDRGNGWSCGCERDSDCGDAQSGRLCELTPEAQRCVEGCVDGFGRNGCPASMSCTSRDPANPGVCVALCDDDAGCLDAGALDAGAPDAGTDAAIPPDASHVADAGVDAAAMPEAPVNTGCQCSTVGDAHKRSTPGGLWLMVPLAWWVRRVRRGRRCGRHMARLVACAMVLASLASACAQSQLSTDVDSGLGMRPDVVVRDAAPAVDAACRPQLGAHLVDHACQHATLGRYVDVIAATHPGATPPWVNSSHKAYRIATPTRAVAATASVAYRPSRAGDHVVMLGPATALQVRPQDTDADLTIRHQETLGACAPELNVGHVVGLESGRTYRLELSTDTATERRLFIEHVDTFGDRAWDRTCE